MNQLLRRPKVNEPSRERGPKVAGRQLRTRLKRARDAAGKSQPEVAKALDWSISKVARIEGGENRIGTSDLLALLTQYGIDDQDEVATLVELARASRKATVASRYKRVLDDKLAEWLEHEAFANGIKQYETKIVPGILQIDGYATPLVRSLLGEVVDDDPDDLTEFLVKTREERALPLKGPAGPPMSFIIDEAALRRGVGNEEAVSADGRDYVSMKRLLESLKEMNTVGRRANGEPIADHLNPNVSIRIVPFSLGAYPALRGPFELLEFDDPVDTSMVFLENPDGDALIKDNPEVVLAYLDLFLRLEKLVPGPEETNAMIDGIISAMSELRNSAWELAAR